jgi:hypothetical protein
VKVFLVKTRSGHLVPATEQDKLKLRALRPGDMLPVRIRKARNGDHHRKFMALVTFVADHHPSFDGVHPEVAIERLLDKLKMATGLYTHYILPETGEVVFRPGSISFDEMDEGDFVVWSAKAREEIFTKYLPEFSERDKARLAAEIDGWLRWT